MAYGLLMLKSRTSRVCFKDKEKQPGWIFFPHCCNMTLDMLLRLSGNNNICPLSLLCTKNKKASGYMKALTLLCSYHQVSWLCGVPDREPSVGIEKAGGRGFLTDC